MTSLPLFLPGASSCPAKAQSPHQGMRLYECYPELEYTPGTKALDRSEPACYTTIIFNIFCV